VIEILQSEINKRKLPVHISAIVNDTVGTLMARSYTSPSEDGSLIGAIFGTGTNGAYIEKVENIPKLSHIKGIKSMVINMEWAAFDNKASSTREGILTIA
jgi:hexokinase